MENEKKAQGAKVEVQKKEELKSKIDVIDSPYKGITIVKDKNFVPKGELTKDMIKNFSRVLVELEAKFTLKANTQRDSIKVRVYPFKDKKDPSKVTYSGQESKKFNELIRLNDDNSVRLTRNDFVDILISLNIAPEIKDKFLRVLRYARFITAVDPKNNRRNYRVQVFFSPGCVESIFIEDSTLETVSTLISAGYIPPVQFIEASSEFNFELEKDEEKD